MRIFIVKREVNGREDTGLAGAASTTQAEGELKAFRGEVVGEFRAISEQFNAVNGRIESVEKQMGSDRRRDEAED